MLNRSDLGVTPPQRHPGSAIFDTCGIVSPFQPLPTVPGNIPSSYSLTLHQRDTSPTNESQERQQKKEGTGEEKEEKETAPLEDGRRRRERERNEWLAALANFTMLFRALQARRFKFQVAS